MRILLSRVGILLALAPFLLLAAFNHPYLDDYQNAFEVRTQGLGAAQLTLYQSWTGRYASTFLLLALNPLTYGWLGGVKVAAALLLALQWGSLTSFLRVVLPTALRQPCSWPRAGWTAALLLAIFCNAAPEPYSFLYWFTGAMVYQVPYLGLLNFTTLAVLAGWGAPRWQRPAAWLAVPCLVLAVAGNELMLLQTLVVLGALGGWLPALARRKWVGWLLVALVAGAVAVVAPGNWQRAAQTYPGAHSQRVLLLLPRAVCSGVLFLGQPVVGGSLLATALLGLALGRPAGGTARRHWASRRWLWVGLGFIVLNSVGFFLFRYVWVETPVLRAQNEILLVLLVSTLVVAWAAGAAWPVGERAAKLGRWSLPVVLAGLFVAGHVRHAWLELATSAPTYEQQMQARYRLIRAAQAGGQPAAVLPALHLTHRRLLAPLRHQAYPSDLDVDLFPGCSGRTNEVMARYFALRRVCLLKDDKREPVID